MDPGLDPRPGTSPTMTKNLAAASLAETRHLLASPANAARLAESIVELEAGNGTERQLSE